MSSRNTSPPSANAPAWITSWDASGIVIKYRVTSRWVRVTGPPSLICRWKRGTTEPLETGTLQKRTIAKQVLPFSVILLLHLLKLICFLLQDGFPFFDPLLPTVERISQLGQLALLLLLSESFSLAHLFPFQSFVLILQSPLCLFLGQLDFAFGQLLLLCYQAGCNLVQRFLLPLVGPVEFDNVLFPGNLVDRHLGRLLTDDPMFCRQLTLFLLLFFFLLLNLAAPLPTFLFPTCQVCMKLRFAAIQVLEAVLQQFS